MKRSLPLLCALFLLIGVGSASPASKSSSDVVVTKSYKGMKATLYFSKGKNSYGLDTVSHVKLVVWKEGKLIFSGAPGKDCKASPALSCAYPSLSIHPLSNTGDMATIVDHSTGGAHCCEDSFLVYWDNIDYRSYTLEKNWGEAYHIIKSGSDYFFVGADYSFDYAFASHADSLFPVRVYQLRKYNIVAAPFFEDETAGEWGFVKKDADMQWKYYLLAKKEGRDPRGALAAWAADEHMLGNTQVVDEKIGLALNNGELTGDGNGAAGKAYLPFLKDFLIHHRYTPWSVEVGRGISNINLGDPRSKITSLYGSLDYSDKGGSTGYGSFGGVDLSWYAPKPSLKVKGMGLQQHGCFAAGPCLDEKGSLAWVISHYPLARRDTAPGEPFITIPGAYLGRATETLIGYSSKTPVKDIKNPPSDAVVTSVYIGWKRG
jgi:hypothetical protein